MLNAVSDAFLDTVKVFPFLLASYLFIEYIEHRAGEKLTSALYSLGWKGPFLGALTGVFPICGLAVSAADLFANRLISPGTLTAALIACSDEAILVLFSTPGVRTSSFLLCSVKFILGFVFGLLADVLFRHENDAAHAHEEHDHLHEHCDENECEEQGILMTALKHTLTSSLFILATAIILEILFDTIGTETVSGFFHSSSSFHPLIAVLLGLIPNCAPSIILSEFYIEGLIGFSAMTAGLVINAGVGLAVLWKQNHRVRESLLLTLYLSGVAIIAGYVLPLFLS